MVHREEEEEMDEEEDVEDRDSPHADRLEQARVALQKRILEMHTTLISAIAGRVSARALDDFFEVEDRFLRAPHSVDLDAVEDLLMGRRVVREAAAEEDSDGDRHEPSAAAGVGTPEDRLRLFLMVYLSCRVDEDRLTTFFDHLRKGGADVRVFKHLARLRELHPDKLSSTSRSWLLNGGLGRLRMLEGHTSKGLAAAITRDYLSRTPPATVISRDPFAADAGGGPGPAGLMRAAPAAGAGSSARPSGPGSGGEDDADADWDHALVFMVGGGSLAERDDVVQTIGRGCDLPVVYGCTDLPSPRAFLRQLCSSA